MSRWRNFLRRSWHERALFLEACAWLFWSRGLILCLPFHAYAKRLGRPQTESIPALCDEQQRIVRQVKWAVQTAVRYSPVRFVCLPQAMAAKWMLRRRRVPATLYLGLQQSGNAPMQAHAWLRAGECLVTGGRESRTHRAIATFAD